MATEIPSIVLVGRFDAENIKIGLAQVGRDLEGARDKAGGFFTQVNKIGRESVLATAAVAAFGAVTLGALTKLSSVGPNTQIAFAQAEVEATRFGLILDQVFGKRYQVLVDIARRGVDFIEGAGLTEATGNTLFGAALGGVAGGAAALLGGGAAAFAPVAIGVGGFATALGAKDQEKGFAKYAQIIGGLTATGAVLGSVIPGVGTLAGAAGGALAGGAISALDYFDLYPGSNKNGQGQQQSPSANVDSVTVYANNLTIDNNWRPST